jgi:hypothetical protein
LQLAVQFHVGVQVSVFQTALHQHTIAIKIEHIGGQEQVANQKAGYAIDYQASHEPSLGVRGCQAHHDKFTILEVLNRGDVYQTVIDHVLLSFLVHLCGFLTNYFRTLDQWNGTNEEQDKDNSSY